MAYVIERVDPPRWVASGAVAPKGLDESTGEQAEWGWAIPVLYDTLNAPTSGRPFPRPPSSPADFQLALGYWAALMHMLVYAFGWARPDRGLKWWYDAGKPVDEPRLELLRDVWEADGQLDWFAAWLWSCPEHPYRTELARVTGASVSDSPALSDKTLIERAVAAAESSGIPNPATGGYDALHLSGHCVGPLEEARTTPTLLHSDTNDRRAVLIVDSMRGWYSALAAAAADLPDIGDHSWYVDVIAKPVGFLGTFRRSRQTGLWFAGKHSVHVRGN